MVREQEDRNRGKGMAAVGPVRKSGHLRVQAAPDEAVAWDVQG